MGLKAPSNGLVVTPSGDNAETRRGALFVVEHNERESKTWRGVVDHVGSAVPDIEVGDLLHYTACTPIGEKHVVPYHHVIAYEDDE